MANEAFNDQIIEMADTMGIALYTRFSLNEAALFLRCPIDVVQKLVRTHQISYVQLTDKQFEFLGFQLLEYLTRQIVPVPQEKINLPNGGEDRIINIEEVRKLVNLSRSTIWRKEQTGEFPRRVSLTSSRVGWRYQEVIDWIRNKT